jgi:hypothetical protein
MDKIAWNMANVMANEVQSYAQWTARNAWNDLKKLVDEKAGNWEGWELLKADKYISKTMMEAFEPIIEIFGN